MKPVNYLVFYLFVISNAVMADGVYTQCEMVGEGRFACDTFSRDGRYTLVSQTWQMDFGAVIQNQGVGYMVAQCSSDHSGAQYRFIAALDSGENVSYTGNLPCNQSSGGGSAGPGGGCFGRLDQFGNCIAQQ